MLKRIPHIRIFVALASFMDSRSAFSQVTLVRDGKATAVVVTAVKPSQVATYAVEELVNHMKQATGQVLPVVVETAIPLGYESRVFVGVSDTARKQGIDTDKLEIEQYMSNATVEKNQIINIEALFEGKGKSKATDPDDDAF